MIGMSKEEAIGLPLSQLNVNELTLSLVNRYNHTWPLAIELVSGQDAGVRVRRFSIDLSFEVLPELTPP